MPKMLIDVYGIGSIDKSGVLSRLIAKLKESNGYQQFQENRSSDAVLWVIGRYNARIIGIMTNGESVCENNLDVFLEECLKNSCDVIYTASRTYGKIYNKVKEFAINNDYTFIETSPLYIRAQSAIIMNESLCQDESATMLLDLISHRNTITE